MTLVEVMLAHLDSAEARFEVERVSALYRFEQGLREAGTDADEIAARVERYAVELEVWRDEATLSVAGALKDFLLKAGGSIVGIEGQSGTRH